MVKPEVDGVELPPARSFLTDSNRDYLFGKKEYSDSAARQHRYQIRQNLKSALIDFQLLWELDDPDLIRAVRPMAEPLRVDKIDSRAIETEPDLGEIELSDLDHDDTVIGREMLEGLEKFVALFTYIFGPEDFGKILERGMNKGSIQNSLRVGEETGVYDLQVKSVDPQEKIDGYGLE